MNDTDALTKMLHKASTRELECDDATYRQLVSMLRFWQSKFPKEFKKALAHVTIDKRETLAS